jgi:hypothetical protein
MKMMSKLDQQANEQIALAGVKSYLRFGFTTLQEGRATKEACDTWKALGEQKRLLLMSHVTLIFKHNCLI